MGDWAHSIKWHYTKRNLEILKGLRNGPDVLDDDDKSLLEELISKLELELANRGEER